MRGGLGYPLVMHRVGFGYDSHRFADDRPLILGGVRIEGESGLSGHSDADAVLHAITDAILGAIAAGDIGEQFPDTDPRWSGAASAQFVRHAVQLAKAKGLCVTNCDVTVLAERPNLSAHKVKMRTCLAELLALPADVVSVKAKTNEGMGFVGAGEGIAAFAVVLLQES